MKETIIEFFKDRKIPPIIWYLSFN
jgi:hypothetical protein